MTETKPETVCPNLIAGATSALGSGRFKAVSPATGEAFGPEYAEATAAEIDAAVSKAAEVGPEFGRDAELRARLLNTIAEELECAKEELVEIADAETALGPARLSGEVGRTQSQLRMFADLILEGSWVDAVIDAALPDRKPAPRPDLRRMLMPLGPVAVFGASNFPFAFSVAGGDTASALAAGCPVVVKGHPAHPGTSAGVAAAIAAAVGRTKAPAAVFSLVQGGPGVGQALVEHESLEAVAFTGSLRAGRALFDLAARRPKPIPVFAEMGSVNPVFILPGALVKDLKALAEGYAASLTMGVGQFCTNPGLVFGVGAEFEQFLDEVEGALQRITLGSMLTPQIREAFQSGVQERKRLLCADGIDHARPTLFRTDLKGFLRHPSLLEELFGPAGLAVSCPTVAHLVQAAASLPGQLTATIHAIASEGSEAAALVDAISQRVGRVVFNGFPTGVEVCPAMQHGGPYPSTTDSRFTSVGTGAIKRFARPVTLQALPDPLLPRQLKDGNPDRIWRTVNGTLTRDPIDK